MRDEWIVKGSHRRLTGHLEGNVALYEETPVQDIYRTRSHFLAALVYLWHSKFLHHATLILCNAHAEEAVNKALE